MRAFPDFVEPPAADDLLDCRKFYINGEWVNAATGNEFQVVNPATETPIATISLSAQEDVDKAVAAAKRAFEYYSESSVDDRLRLLRRVADVYQSRMTVIAKTISAEMGAPISLARSAQAPAGLAHFSTAVQVLEDFKFEELEGTTLLRKEPIGVCGLITPWNWPMNQICCKVAPALAAGCTMVLKPSEIAPLSALMFAQILHDAGVPKGVFNLVNGSGTVGTAVSCHPGISMISFTGSVATGVQVATMAAPGVKRVTQELGGKSANLILDDADLESMVRLGVQACFRNTGQSCNAPSRLLVPRSKMKEATEIACQTATSTMVGDPCAEDTTLGPLAGQAQFDKVQRAIAGAIEEGATLIAGGLGRPAGITRGYFVRPTIFSPVDNTMRVAREEIFGPVLCVIPYDSDEDAIRIANDSPYGLSGYVSSRDMDRARQVAKRIRAGNIHLNYARLDFAACFGGYKQSGNGREWGKAGLEEFLELKAIFGYSEPVAA
jgi:aldehyde dehydrogenase (NAD+)